MPPGGGPVHEGFTRNHSCTTRLVPGNYDKNSDIKLNQNTSMPSRTLSFTNVKGVKSRSTSHLNFSISIGPTKKAITPRKAPSNPK